MSAPLSMRDIRKANKRAGGQFFARDTMRFWGCSIVAGPFSGPHGVTFVTFDKVPRPAYNIRIFYPDSSGVGTAPGGWQYSTDEAEAITGAVRYADSGTLPPPANPGPLRPTAD